MKRMFKVGIFTCLFFGFLYSSALGEVSVFEIAGTQGVNEVSAAIVALPDINTKDDKGMTVLMWAAWKNPNLGVIRALIEAGVDPGIKDNGGYTALDYAKKELNYDKLKSEAYKLLWTKDKTLPKDIYFIELCGSGKASEVDRAIKEGANVNAEDKYGISPIFWAAWLNADAEVIRALITAGANPNIAYNKGLTPLIMAAGENPNPEVIIALLNGGADPKIQDASGKKAIDHAEVNKALKGTKAYSMLKEASK